MKIILAKLIGFFINCIALFNLKAAVHLAVKLFSTPLKGKHVPEGKDFLNTAFQEEVICKDVSVMTYRWLGKKDTILLVHGWESNAFRWKDLILKLILRDYNVIALDAPAHGRSGGKSFNVIDYSECIYRVAKKFNAKTVIGHSMGGMATVFFQYKYKLPYLKKIVLLGAPSNAKGIIKRYTKLMGYSNRVIKALDFYVLNRFGNTLDYFDSAQFSKDITAKGLIIHDVDDTIIPYNDALTYKSQYVNAELISTKNLDHSLKSEETEKHILKFINN